MLEWCLFWMLTSASSAGWMAQQTLTSSPCPCEQAHYQLSPSPGTLQQGFFGVCTCSPHAPSLLSPGNPGTTPGLGQENPFFSAGFGRRGQALGAAQAFRRRLFPLPETELNLAGRRRGNSWLLGCLQNSKSNPWNSARWKQPVPSHSLLLIIF